MALDAQASLSIAHANFGKWHLADDDNGGSDSPNLLGWGHYEGLISGDLSSYFRYQETLNGTQQLVENYATSEVVDDALAWVVQQDGQWVMWLGFNAPHEPYHLPPSELHSQGDLSGEAEEIEEDPLPYFKAMLEALDTEIGRLLETLGEEVLSDTHVVFLGDNGSAYNVNQGIYPGHRSKGSVYQGGIHVPLVVSGPIVEDPGRHSQQLVSVNDIFATLLELEGIDWRNDLPAGVLVDSYSLVPALQSSSPDPESREWAMAERLGERTEGGHQRALRLGDYKLIELSDTQHRLYDLATDPLETIDLIEATLSPSEQSVYEELLAISADWRSRCQGVAKSELCPRPHGLGRNRAYK